MKPLSKKESYWRTFGKEYRHYFQMGHGAGKVARNFTHRQCSKAMRSFGKLEIQQAIKEII